jgi:hypothetical protein
MSRKSVQGFCANGVQKTKPHKRGAKPENAAGIRLIANGAFGYPLGMMTFFAFFSARSC